MGNTYFNNKQIKDIFLNNQRFKKMYLGINVIWDFLKNAFSSFKSMVLADAGTFENDNAINDLTAELLQEASLVITPNAVKTSKLYAVKPDNGSGDLTVTRATTATRVNASGIIEVVPANTARIDYSTGNGMILVEQQRTNLLLRSEEFDNAYWFKSLGTLTQNATIAPDGTLTADLWTKTSIISTVCSISRSNTIFTTTGIHTLSFYCKPNVGNIVLFRLDRGGNTCNALFNFTTKTFTAIGANVISTLYEKLPNGWFRLILVGNVLSTTWNIDIANLFSNQTNDSVYVWGAQLEAGSNATSYIPTTSASVTRNADVITASNVFTNNFITSNGGTLFLNLSKNDLLVRQAAQGIFLNQLLSNTGYGIHIVNNSPAPSSARLGVRKIDINGNSAIYTTTNSNLKLLIKWNGSTLDIFENGVKVISGSSFLATNMQFLSFQALDVVKNINNCLLFPIPLTDAEAIKLTTL